MHENYDYSRMSVAAVKALAQRSSADFEVFLPSTTDQNPVLYRKGGMGLADPDFRRMAEVGVPFIYVRTEDFHECEKTLEAGLGDILANPGVGLEDKAQIVHSVGASVARDIMRSPASPEGFSRTSKIVDGMIDSVLADPMIAGFLLDMARHERTTASHMFVVSALAVMLGYEVYGADHDTLKALGFAGMLHDTGKLTIPPEILNKSTSLTRTESELVQQHPVESVRLVGSDPHASPTVRKLILQHHERVDGCGYPVGVKGAELLQPSRLLSIVDSFHAMIGRRSYRAPMSTAQANRVLNTQAGRQFDPDLLASWIALCERYQLEKACDQEKIEPDEQEECSSKHEHRAVAPPPKIIGQRRPRFECKDTTMVQCFYAGRLPDTSTAPDEFSALVHDVSRGGLCIYTAHPMYRGELLNIRVKTDGDCAWLRSMVAWCRQKDADVYRIGVRFICRIPDEESREQVSVTSIEGIDPAVLKESRTAAGNKGDASPVRDKMPVREKPDTALKTLAAIASTSRPGADAQRTVATLAMSGDVAVRLKAVEVLINIGTRIARDALVALLRDTNGEVREQAAVAVGVLKIPDAIEALRNLLRDPVEQAALRAAGALGKLGDQSGMRLVGRILGSDGEHVRLAALVFGDITGHHFGASREGVRSARRYMSAKKLVTAS